MKIKTLVLYLVTFVLFSISPVAISAVDKVKLDEDMKNNPNCKALFLSRSYQRKVSGLEKVAFSVARDEDGIRLCAWRWVGFLASTKTLINNANAGCEEMRINYMTRTRKPTNSCEIYAIGNEIQ